MKDTKKKVKKSNKKVDWQRVISLSVAGQYISERLREELEKVSLPSKK